MTSTNDGKDVKSNQTSAQRGKSHYIELYKSLDAHLTGDGDLRARTAHLSDAWCRVHSICAHSAPSTHPHLIAWIQRHTSKTILQTQWQSPLSREYHDTLDAAIRGFTNDVEDAIQARETHQCLAWEGQLLERAVWFRSILSNPWDHPVLKVLLNPKEKPPSDDEVLAWLREERGITFTTRLRQLAMSKGCDDLALKLATAIMGRVRACTPVVPDMEQLEEPRATEKQPPAPESPSFESILRTECGFTQDVWDLITDIELVLLLKQKDNAQCINLAKATPLRLGHPLVERLASRLELTPREKKIWKGARDVATLVAQVIITRCMVVPWCVGAARTALYWCARSVARLVDAQRLPRVANALAAPAATARHLHTLATAHYAQEKEARQTEQTLAAWFIQLGSLLSSSARINCECKLTAFSVHPSPGMYERIKLAPPLPPRAVETQEPVKQETDDPGFGSWATDSRKQTNFVKTSTNLNLQSTQDLANVLSTAIFAEGEGLGLTAELCQDLAVLLSGPRVKTLSWDLDREQLLEYCRTYMERTSGGTRVLTTELRYLNLDPRTYQHLPEEDDGDDDLYYGIEKGYEHLIEFEFEPQPEQIWQDPLWDPEATDSAESDIGDLDYTTTTRRKKKSKYTSDSDNDPLSLEAEAKRTEKKKERPHSKERSKDGNNKNKPKEPNQKEKQKRHKKQDKKRSHKKKNDEDDQTLSKFLGFKVASSFEEEFRNSLSAQSEGVGTSVTNSDNGTQGSSSKDNKAGVSRDGVPVEEVIKALEGSSLESGASNKTKEVKNSISKLLQYRKQKSNANTNSSLISLVGSKIVNKEMSESQSMQLNELANEMESLLSDKPAAPQCETKPVSGDVPNEPNSAVQSKAADISSKIATVKPGQKKRASRKKSEATQVKNTPKQSQNQHSNTPSQPQTYAAGQKSISTQTSDFTQEGCNVLFEVHQNSYQRFLMELQHTKRLALERNSEGSTNASKPAGKRTQVTPSTGETSSTLPQSGKPNQQKIDNAPNTFARRNHLHKTNKRVTEHEEALRCSISREIDQRIANLTNSKMQKTQNSNLTTSRMSNSNPKETESPKENSRVEMQRVEKPTPAAMLRAGNPVLSHMLQGNEVIIARNPAYVNQAPKEDSPDQTKNAPPLRSSLSEQDQQDVMSVLWQQNKLNSNAPTQGISNANTLNTQKVNDRSRNAVEDIRKIQNKLIFGSPNPQPEGLQTSVIPQNTAIRTAALIQNLQSSKKSKPKVKHCPKKDNVDHSPSSVLAKRYSSPVPATPQHLGLSSEVQHAPNNDKIQHSLVSTPDESKSATNSVITAAPQNIGISPQVKYLSKKHEIRHSLGLLSEKTNNSINTIPATLKNIGTPATVKHCPKKNDFQTSNPTLAPSSNNTVTATPQNVGATSRNWTSIMDGLRKLKTPSRGPTALDIVLQQSHENPSTGNLRQQRIVKTSSRPTSLERPQSQSDRAVDFASESKVVDSKSISTSAARNEPKRQTAVAKTGQKRARKPRNSTPKALQVLQQPVKLLEAKKPIIQYPKRDPIVPGILRSDYDMIEELITDELREEMSEDLDESLPPEQSKSLNEPENHTRAKVLNSPTITSYKGTVHNTSKHLRIVADLTGKPEIVPNVDTKDNLRILSNVAISYINSPAKPEYAPNVACKEKPRILSNVPISHVNLPLKPEYVPNVAKEKLRILSNVPISPTMPLSPKIKNSLAKNVHTNIPIKLTDTVSPVRVSNVVQQQQKPVLKLPNALKSNIVTNTIQYQTIPQNIFVVGPKTVYDPFAAQTDTDSNDFKHNTQIGLDTVTLYRDPQGMTLENPILIDLPQNLQNSTFHVKPAQTNPSGDTIKTPISSYSTNTTTLNPTQKYQNVGKTSNLVTDQTYKPLTQTEPKLHPDDMNKTKLDSDLSLERKMLSELLETKNQDRLKKKRLAIVNRQLDHRCSYTTIPLPYTPMPCKSKTSLLEAGKLTNESSETQCQILESNELLDKRVADFISKEISQLANSANISTNQKATICSNNEEKEVQTPKSVQSTTEVTELLLKSSEAGIASIGKEGIINASLKTSETLAGIKLAETDDSKSTETKTSAKRPVKKSDGSNKKADASNIIPTRVSKRIQSRKQKKAKEKAKRAETQLKRAQEQKEALEILEQSLAISEKTNNLQMEPSLQNVENDLTLSGNKNRPNIISLHDIDFPKFEIGSYTNTETKNGMPQNHSSIGDESNVDHSKKQSDTGRAKLVDKKPTIEKIEVSPTLTKLENEIKTAIEDITMSTVEALVSEKEEVLLDQQKSVSKTAQLMNNQQKTVTMDVAVNKSRKSITATVSGIPAQATEMAILKSQDFADREENVGLAKNNSVLQMQSSPNEIKMNDGITTSKLDVPVNQAPHVGEQMLTQDPLSEKNGVVNEEKNSGLANTLTTSKLTFTTINEEKQFKAPTVTTTNIFEGKNSNVINLESDSDTENHPTVTAANIFEGKNANVINLESDSDTENQEIAGKTQRNACTLVEGVPEKADIPQSYKDSIKITEIPQTNPAPFTKVVRIAMPDNRVLRATVYGNLLVSFDTLFKDPALRDVLLSGLNKRYTVNVQHAAEKDNIVLTKVLNYKVIHNVDTVNLISDDEEEPVQETSTDKKSPQYFLTEFGKHDIGDLDREMHAKHQNKFSQNCSVRLVKCDNKQLTQQNSDCDEENILCTESLSISPKSIVIENIPKQIPEIIELDDSSNDSDCMPIAVDILDQNAPPKLKIDRFINRLMKDYGVDDVPNSQSSQINEECAEPIVLDKDNINDVKTADNDKTSDQKDEYPNINSQCFVKLTRCDDAPNTIFDSYENSTSEKDTNDVVLESPPIPDDEIPDLSPLSPPLTRSGSFSILGEVELDSNTGSPVIDITETISNFLGVDKIHDNKEITSVMEAYDIMVSNRFEVQLAEEQSQPSCCGAEWFNTKLKCQQFALCQNTGHNVENLDISNNVLDEPKDCEDIFDYTSDISNSKSVTTNAPSLKTIMAKYFANLIIPDSLTGVSDHKSEVLTPLNLKRKSTIRLSNSFNKKTLKKVISPLKSKCDKNDDTLHIPEVTNIIDSGCTQLHVSNVAGIKTQDMDMDKNGDVEMLQDVQNDYKNPTETANKPTHPEKKHPDIIENGNIEPRDPGNLIKNDSDKSNESSLKSTINYKLSLKEVFEESTINHKLILIEDVCEHIDTEITDLKNKIKCNNNNATTKAHQSVSVEELAMNTVEKDKEVNMHQDVQKDHKMNHQTENKVGCGLDNPGNHLHILENENTDQQHIDTEIADIENKVNCNTIDATAEFHQSDNVEKIVLNDVEKNKEVQIYHGDRKSNENRYSHHQIENEMGCQTTNPKLKENHLDAIKNENTDEGDSKIVTENLSDQSMKSICKHEVSLESTINEELNQTEVCEHIDIKVADAENKMDSFTHDATTVVLQNDSVGKLASKHEQLGVKVEQSPVNDGIASSSVNLDTERSPKSLSGNVCSEYAIIAENTEKSPVICDDKLIQEIDNDDILDKNETNIEITKKSPSILVEKSIQEVDYDNVLDKNATLIYRDHTGVVLHGIEYEDPVIGTCFVFPLSKSSDSSDFLNDSGESVIEVIKEDDLDVNEVIEYASIVDHGQCSSPKELDNLCYEEIKLNIPKVTYSKKYLKRKICMSDISFSKKRACRSRSRENSDSGAVSRSKRQEAINVSKSTAASNDTTFCKDFKILTNYHSNIKFSYNSPNGLEYFDVNNLLTCWPIKGPVQNIFEGEPDAELFTDMNNEPLDPEINTQTLAEEISADHTKYEKDDHKNETVETDFSMGFGERSGRVISHLKDFGAISKFSAATLPDVKQYQPLLLSKDSYTTSNQNYLQISAKSEQEGIQRFIRGLQLREQVQSFFKNTAKTLSNELMNEKGKNHKIPKKDSEFDFDLYMNGDFKPAPVEMIVQVVQVGQLPVSAGAQNPVCDPRVTHVSDASPSQCSVDNSSPNDTEQGIKTEYTELTTADLSMPVGGQEFAKHPTVPNDSPEPRSRTPSENITIESSMIKTEVRIEIEEESPPSEFDVKSHDEFQSMNNPVFHNTQNHFEENARNSTNQSHSQLPYESSQTQENIEISQQEQPHGSPDKTDQIAHAMTAAGIATDGESTTESRTRALVNLLTQNIYTSRSASDNSTNSYPKTTTSISAMSLQQALAQILPPPLNQTTENNQQGVNSVTSQVLHIVQSKNSSGNITLVDNSQKSVINSPNATPVLHIVQNKAANNCPTSNGGPVQQQNSFTGLSLVDAGLQQGGNQLLHIVNTGNQKNVNTSQLLKRVNLLTNLANVQGSNEQKMLQFVCKSADGKSIQLNAPHQRSMVLRLQPIETPNPQTPSQKSSESSDTSSTSMNTSAASNKDTSASQQEIKSRSVYEENYAKFIQNSSSKPGAENSTSLPKFNQAFGKPVFQDGIEKASEMDSNNVHMASVNSQNENSECQSSENSINLEHMGSMNNPPLLLRKSPAQVSQSQPSIQHIKQTIAPMNIQTMHGGVIYTRQIPVNIGGGQTINLISVPSTELIDESGQKSSDLKFVSQGDIEPSIIKIVPQSQAPPNAEVSQDDGNVNLQNDGQNSQSQPVLTQMRIKLPMLSKNPQMIAGARVVRPSFFQIQRNVIGGANQPVYQQLVLTAAPPLGQQTIRLPQAQARKPENHSPSESQMSSSTLEQLREFDMVLEQVKERSTVQPSPSSGTFSLNAPSTDSTDSPASTGSTPAETTQVLYSIGGSQPMSVAYVNRASVNAGTRSNFTRSPDSSGIADSSSSSTQSQMPHTVTIETAQTSHESTPTSQKPARSHSKSKSRPKSSSHSSHASKINAANTPKPSTQKPIEDEQTTQRILYILAEYKEQVENSPDKDKPAPRRRTNGASIPGSSRRKKRRSGARDLSPLGDDTCRTMGSEDSSCGTSQGDCAESCVDANSPQGSPRKVARKLTFDQDPTPSTTLRPQPPRNVIVADGQTITVARGTAPKPATAVIMPTNYLLPVSMVKGGQQIAIVTNQGPKLLTVSGGESPAANALLLQRLIGPAGLKPVLARTGIRHVRLPTSALHRLQAAFTLGPAAAATVTSTTAQPPDSTASPAPELTPIDLADPRARTASPPWTDGNAEAEKPNRPASPEGSEPWNIHATADPHEYTYEETVRTENLERTVLEAIPDRYSPDMDAHRIFDKMFDVESKKTFIGDSPRCGYDIDSSDCEDTSKAYQVVQKKDLSAARQHRLAHISAAALRHKYAILEHELRLQKSLSEECEDLGVDSPSAAELFPEAELLFSGSPAAHDHGHEHVAQHSHTPQPIILNETLHAEIEHQITEQLLPHDDRNEIDPVNLGLEDGVVTVSEDGLQASITLDHEEFARSHPNTTFHSEPTDEGEPVQPFTIAGLKTRHITSTIYHPHRAATTVLMAAPQATVISQTHSGEPVKYSEINHMIHQLPQHSHLNLNSVLVKDDGLTRFDNILTDSRELHLSHTASAIVHASHGSQVIRRVCYEDDKRDPRFLMDEPESLIAGKDAKMVAEDSRDSLRGEVDDGNSSPERHADLFWESNSASERSESRRPLDFSSDSEKCCKSPYDETNSTDSSGVGTHMRLDSVIKDARGIERSCSAGSSADDGLRLRTYPPKKSHHHHDRSLEPMDRSLSGKTRAGEPRHHSPDNSEVRRRASNRGVVKRGCHCCNGSPAPYKPKKPRPKKPHTDSTP